MKNEQHPRPPKKLSQWLSHMSVALFTAWVVACGGQGGNNNQQPVYPQQPVQPVYPNCLNCQNINGSAFFTATSQDQYGVMQFTSWIFLGQNVMTANSYNSPIVSYNGPVSSQGQMQVSQTVTYGYCQLPAGGYTLSTLSVGQWSGGVVSNLRMQASGAAQIIMTLSQGQVEGKTGSQLGYAWNEISPTGRMFGNLVLESVNGVPCQYSVLIQ